MSAMTWAGVLLVVLPVAFNAAFAGLAATFEYPDVLRRPTAEVLARFRARGTTVPLLFGLLALCALSLAPTAALLAIVVADGGLALAATGACLGVLAGLVQAVGLVRWPFAVPHLARVEESGDAAEKAAVDVVFQALHRSFGVAVGEHLGYLLTGVWSVLAGVAVVRGSVLPAALGVPGPVLGALLVVCSLEFVGPAEPRGWRLAGTLTPLAYLGWSLWLAALGIGLLLA